MHAPPEPTPASLRPRDGIVAAAALLATLVVILATRGPALPVGVGYDDAIYVDLARSLAAGEGYRHGYLPGSPVAVHYPPLFPVWLVVWDALGGGGAEPGWWHSLGIALLTAAAAGVWTLWGARALRLPAWLAALVASASLLIFPARMLSALVFSEPLAWLLLGATALAATARGRWWAAPILGGLLPMVRTALVPFPLALGAAAAFDRTLGRRVLVVALALAPTVVWSLYTARHAGAIPDAWVGSYGSYTDMLAHSGLGAFDLVPVALLQTRALLSLTREMFTLPGAIVALGCLMIGFARLWRVQPPLAWGTAGYLLLVLIWPFTPERFMWGILPLLALTATEGGRWVLSSIPSRPLIWRGFAAMALLVPVVAYAGVTVDAYATRGWTRPLALVGERNAPLIRWGRAARPTIPVATETDGLFALATALRAFPAVTPDAADKLDRGAPLRERLEQSLCTVDSGWIALTTLSSDLAAAVRENVRDSTSRLLFAEPQHVGSGAVVARFQCR